MSNCIHWPLGRLNDADVYLQIVMRRDAENLVTSGLFIGDDFETYLQAARLSREQNITVFGTPVKKMVAVMQPDEFRTRIHIDALLWIWLGLRRASVR